MAKGNTSTLTQDTFTGVFGPVGGIILTLCLVLLRPRLFLDGLITESGVLNSYLVLNISTSIGPSLFLWLD